MCAYYDSTARGNPFTNPRSVISCPAIGILKYDLVHTNYCICSFLIHPEWLDLSSHFVVQNKRLHLHIRCCDFSYTPCISESLASFWTKVPRSLSKKTFVYSYSKIICSTAYDFVTEWVPFLESGIFLWKTVKVKVIKILSKYRNKHIRAF